MPGSRLVSFLWEEFKELLPPTLFFAIGFNLIELTTQLVLDDYLVRFANFLVATVSALVVGKAVLVANLLPFVRRFDSEPLIRPVLFKTVVYTVAVAVMRFLERIIEYAIGGGTIDGLPAHVVAHFAWHRFVAIQLWVFILFLLYTSVRELHARLGRGVLAGMFFTRRSEPCQTRGSAIIVRPGSPGEPNI
jgi:AcrR family transcriptional regulator